MIYPSKTYGEPQYRSYFQVLSRFDTDSSGDLSFEEYLALMAVWVEEDETQIIEAFKVGIFLGRFIEDLADLSNK